MKRVAVIILNWNGAKLLRRYLPTVIEGTDTAIADVIVADNGSSDDSLQVLEEEFPQVKVLKFDKNYGFSEGYNLAIKQTMYPYTVLLNSDVRTPRGWLNPLLDHMERYPDVGAVMPKMLHDRDDDKQMFEYAGAAGGYVDCHGYPYCRGRIFEYLEEDKGQYDDGPKSVFWGSGACLMVRSQLYQDVGALDKDFFAHMEEIDLCWRIRLAGYELMIVPSSHVYHLGGGSLPQGNPRKTYLNFRNNLLLLHKNLPKEEGKKLLIVRRLMDTLAFGMALTKFHFGDAWAIIRAHRDFRKMRKNYTSQPSVNLLKALPEERVNIITSHYLKGVKRFTQLKIQSTQ
ncbi:MAG: glycosyltransferase family 2 protein [Muribaculaceae bacterium]|nr:glycosyltransferase family 2 protein [Muribaculaceae bacterium]